MPVDPFDRLRQDLKRQAIWSGSSPSIIGIFGIARLTEAYNGGPQEVTVTALI